MEKGLYIYQDIVSNAVSEVLTAESDSVIKRSFQAQADFITPEYEHIIRDTSVFKIGVLNIDDVSGEVYIVPLESRLVCRGTDFEIGTKAVREHA